MVKNPLESTIKWLMGSIDSYMRGEQNLNYAVGVVRQCGLGKVAIKKIFDSYNQTYNGKPKFEAFKALENECKKLGYV